MKTTALRPTAGFTLIEMIVVMTVAGILLAMVMQFLRVPIVAYLDSVRHQQLADSADTAFRRLARDIRAALPNSLRVTTTGSGATTVSYIEFVPVQDAGRYRADGSSGTLDFTTTDASFDILGSTINLPAGGTYYVVVSNWGVPGGDFYAGDNRSLYGGSTGSAVSSIGMSAFKFPIPSPDQRFYITTAPVSYVCSPGTSGSSGTGTLRRYAGYGISANQPTTFTSGSNALLVGKVSACSVSYTSGTGGPRGIFIMTLQLQEEGETVSLTYQVQVNNAP